MEDQNWRTAMHYSSVPDPYHRRRIGGAEAELEAILGTMKVEDDLSNRSKSFLPRHGGNGYGAESSTDPNKKGGKGGRRDTAGGKGGKGRRSSPYA